MVVCLEPAAGTRAGMSHLQAGALLAELAPVSLAALVFVFGGGWWRRTPQ